MFDLTLIYKYFFYSFLVPMCMRNSLSFVLSDKRHYISLLVIFNVTSFFRWKWGVFWSLSLNVKPYPQKISGTLYTVGFQILRRLWIREMTWQILIMLESFKISFDTGFLLYTFYYFWQYIWWSSIIPSFHLTDWLSDHYFVN